MASLHNKIKFWAYYRTIESVQSAIGFRHDMWYNYNSQILLKQCIIVQRFRARPRLSAAYCARHERDWMCLYRITCFQHYRNGVKVCLFPRERYCQQTYACWLSYYFTQMARLIFFSLFFFTKIFYILSFFFEAVSRCRQNIRINHSAKKIAWKFGLKIETSGNYNVALKKSISLSILL